MENKLTRSKSNLEQVLQAMTTEEKNRNYKEADKLQKEAHGLKKEIEELEKKFNLRKQKRDKCQVSQMLDQEKKLFKQTWEERLSEAKNEGEKLTAEQNARHEEECNKTKTDFEAEQEQYHDSGAVIVLRRKEESLGKQGCYMDAHQIQQQRIKLQAQEKDSFMKLRAEKLKIKIRQLKLRQQVEKEALRKKIEAKFQEMKIQKAQQEEVMNQKHINLQRQFASEQQKENLMRTGMIKNSIYASTALSPSSKIKSRANFLSSQKLPSMHTK